MIDVTNMSLSPEAREAVAVERQLKSELGNVKVKKSDLFAERERIGERIRAGDRDHAAETATAARAGESLPAQAGRAELTAEHDAVSRQIDALRREESGLRRSIEHHRGVHFGELAEVCEQFTQAAAAKEAAAREAYEASLEATRRAAEEWNSLIRDHRLTVNHDVSATLTGVQTSDPLPAAKLFPGAPIRPPKIKPVEEAEEKRAA